MTLPLSEFAYEDVRGLMDKALDSERGIRVDFDSKTQALHIRRKCYRLQSTERRNAKMVYPADHPMHGKSPYDRIGVHQVFDPVTKTYSDTSLIIRRHDAAEFKITEL